MNLVKNRVAAFGAAGALAAGSVLAGGVLAPAGAVDANYTCATSTGEEFTLPVSLDNPFPSSFTSGQAVPSQDVLMSVSIPAELLPSIQSLLAFFGLPTTALSGTVTDAAFTVGSQEVAIDNFMAPSTAFPTSGDMTLPFSGETAAFTPSSSGELPVSPPEGFSFLPMNLEAFAIPCERSADEKEATTTRAKFLNTPLTTAKKPDIRVRVVQEDGDPAAGVVVVKKGKTILKKVTLNDNGKKRFRIAKLKRGEHKLVFKYKGNADSLASKVVKFVKVKRA